jgi:hypothetical protein
LWHALLESVVLCAVSPSAWYTFMSQVYPLELRSFVRFYAKKFVFLLDVLFENYPCFEEDDDFIYCQMFGRVVKF